MRLDVYHISDYGEVHEMLQNHINFAPEYAGTESTTDDTRFFEENYMCDGDRSSAYVCFDDNQQIASFMTCERNATLGQLDWYITNLFVRHNVEEEYFAQKTVELLRKKMSEDASLCINVHPANSDILDFWQHAGYQISTTKTIFSNADSECLVALSYDGTV